MIILFVWTWLNYRLFLIGTLTLPLRSGLEVFRIEKLKVVQITDVEKFGKFYSGDSYIVLSVRA